MENDKIQWGPHIEFAVLFVTLLGAHYMIDAKFERTHERMDRISEEFQQGLRQQADRSDKLYEMFYELLKEKNR